MNPTANAAVQRADEALGGATFEAGRWDAVPSRLVAIGDPQTTAEKFFSVLGAHGLLRDDGLLVDGVTLVSMGDHFDFGRVEGAAADSPVGRAGMRILSWLAAHPGQRVRILLGNHDAARVMELVDVEDDVFEMARRLGLQVEEADDEVLRAELTDRFHATFPQIPTPEVARRDFSAYATEQRTLVMRLLLERRFLLATTGRHADGRQVLLTHAGATQRELKQLGVGSASGAGVLAGLLNARLAAAVADVADDWRAGRWTALELSPLHHAGRTRQESGGLLAHRPANPDRPHLKDRAWEFDERRPRRFHPRDIPAGLAQACGHTRHAKLLKELDPWYGPGIVTAPDASVRSLTVRGGDIRYQPGIAPPDAQHAVMYMLDVDMHRQDAAACEVLTLCV